MNENLGRNDRCHCGSGKKYKQCHLREDTERAQAQKSLKTLGEWVNFYARALRESVSADVAAVAGVDDAAKAWFAEAPAAPMADPAFRDHVLFDLAAGDAPLIARATLEGAEPTGEKAALRDALAASTPSLYRVTECKPGKGVRLVDALTTASRWVGDVALAEQLEPMEVVFGRIVSLRDRNALLEGWRKVVFRKRKAAIADLTAAIEAEGVAADEVPPRAAWVAAHAPQIARRVLEAGLQ